MFFHVAHYNFFMIFTTIQVDKTSLLMDLIAALQAQARRFTSIGHTDGNTGDVFVRSLSSAEMIDNKNTVSFPFLFYVHTSLLVLNKCYYILSCCVGLLFTCTIQYFYFLSLTFFIVSTLLLFRILHRVTSRSGQAMPLPILPVT